MVRVWQKKVCAFHVARLGPFFKSWSVLMPTTFQPVHDTHTSTIDWELYSCFPPNLQKNIFCWDKEICLDAFATLKTTATWLDEGTGTGAELLQV